MKKAIVVASFGTTHEDTRRVTIDKITDRIKLKYSDYDIRTAFTSHGVIRKIKLQQGIQIDTPEEALKKLSEEGYEEVIIQPLHIIPGEEYDYIRIVAESFERKGCFKKLRVGRPALYFKGIEENQPDDYQAVVEAIKVILPKEGAAILMGHGTPHPANACYSCFQSVLSDNELNDVYIASVEGYPTLEDVIKKLKKKSYSDITLIPFMLVAGDHAKNDMAGEDDESWINVLKSSGYKVNVYMHGLGELEGFQNLFLEHLEDVVEGRLINFGRTKKGRR